jgi:hypothetical protein
MDWKNDVIQSRWKLIAIGVSVLALALIAFSGVCWGTLSLCGLRAWLAVEFWDFFAVTCASTVAFFLVRPIRRRLAARRVLSLPPPVSPPHDIHLHDLSTQLSREDRQKLKSVLGRYYNDEPPSPSDMG